MPPDPDLVAVMEAECEAVADDIAGQIVAKIRRLKSENAKLRSAVELAIKSLQWSLEMAPTKKAEQSIEADIKQLQAALAEVTP